MPPIPLLVQGSSVICEASSRLIRKLVPGDALVPWRPDNGLGVFNWEVLGEYGNNNDEEVKPLAGRLCLIIRRDYKRAKVVIDVREKLAKFFMNEGQVPWQERIVTRAEMLVGANLDVLSSKKIRLQLEAKYGIDFTDRKKEIDGLVMDLISEDKEPEKPKESAQQNGAASSKSTAESSSSDDDDEQDDEELARKLQDEEFKSRSRAVKKSRPAKKEVTKKAPKAPGVKRGK
ncbi:hypothetical protein HPB51_005818 [Rhipicephalus microplus]|uniref:DEK-C domain-containing protein n=1 Tax=Rhipicephalus microplus TaxID=6941 RepID=A0A9J6D850_RHIMP|nr:hypothetical protein HPB51_005818 [Rhipicephalus microplus]